MKRTLTILITAMTVTATYGQITTTKVASKVEQTDNTPYDSTINFLGKDVYKYVGQELYLNGIAESLRKYGYKGFSIDYSKSSLTNKSNVYECCDSYNSKYDKLTGKYFTVLEVIKHPKAAESEYLYAKKFYLKLQEKEKKDIVYYEYDSQFEHSFPFIVVGFFENQKIQIIGKKFVFTDRILNVSTGSGIDIITGKPLTITTGEKWRCTDLTIEEKYYSLALVVENLKGEKTTVSYDATFDSRKFAYTSQEAETYHKKFGVEIFNLILKGKVKIGMTKEMCELSWGKPKSINETITSGKKSEQWVYSDNYLYFDNGIVTAMQ
tara:strand:- start:432 stop:1400 length:969 start_codon:yes stop_codon:yes gene_type:complete